MHQNVTVAEAIVLSCFDLEPPRNRIVYVEGEFPSVRYLLQAQPRRREIVVVPDADAVLDAIDERTLLVPVSHVLYKTARAPGRRAVIVRRAHEVGAHVLPRRVPVGRRGAARRDRARRRLRDRRVA